eukprot:s818_g13.t2
MTELEERVKKTPLDTPKALPLAERMVRVEKQKKDLPGLVFDQFLEPAHGLTDKAHAMIEDGVLQYIPPEKCLSRHDEIQNQKAEQQVSFDNQGNLKISKRASDLSCDTSGELRLRQALTRKALACDQAGLCSFKKLEEWHNQMMNATMRTPPSGHEYVTMQQVLNADKELWSLMSQDSRGSLRVATGEDPPLDKLIDKLRESPQILCFMTPLPGSSAAQTAKPQPAAPKATPGPKRPANDVPGPKPSPKIKQRKTEGSGKTVKDLLNSLPTNCVSKTDTGKFICLRYNNGTCVAVMVEICAGSAVLSAEAQRKGFQIFPIDHSHNRFRAAAAILVIDLAHPDARQLLPQLFKTVRPAWCHMGLPCGTCSRDRDRPVSQVLRAAGAPNPRPLRNSDNLFGLPNLTQAEFRRVDAANQVYITAEILLFSCFLLGIYLSVENPERSWLWALLAALVKKRSNPAYQQWYFSLSDITFDACMHGGAYPKATKLKASPHVFDILGIRCDQSHAHSSWGVRKLHGTWKFDTADEAVYPKLLVQRMVDCVIQRLPPHFLQNTWKQFRLDLLQQAGTQHRQQPPLIPEYSSVEWLPEILTAPPCKVLQTPWLAGDSDKGEDNDEGMSKECEKMYKIGFYFSPEEHVNIAMRLQHPASQFTLVPDGLRYNIFLLCTQGLRALAQRRTAYLTHMLDTKKALAGQESELRKTMPRHVEKVTQGKPLCLFRRLLEETAFPDMEVCKIMEHGVCLTGEEPESPLYFKKYRPAMLTPQQLNHQSIWRRRATMSKSVTDEERLQGPDLEAESLSEVEAGFLSGPFSQDEITALVGSEQWSLSKRFALYQGEERKIRIIYNYRDSGVNAAYSSSSYLALHDTDFVIGFLRFFMWVVGDLHEVVVPMSDGTVLRGGWHESLGGKPALLGRCVGLSKAYKQVAIAEESLRHGVLGYKLADGEWRLYTTQSLPFGASASVFAFNKISRAIWHLLVHGLHILTCVFYDDFPCFEVEPLTHLTAKVLDTFFNILGWKHAVTGKKATDFSLEMQALGPGDTIQFDISLGRSAAASLAGILNFCGGFVLGHALKPATHALSKWLSAGTFPADATNETCNLVEFLMDASKPRSITMDKDQQPIIVYTDGAFEDREGAWGALILDATTGSREVFHGFVPTQLLEFWLKTVGDQVICEVEMYAYLCVRWACRKSWSMRSNICFIDNEACRLGLIKRSSPSTAMFLLLCAISVIDTQTPFSSWMERVPSPSNPADLPSRQKADELCRLLNATDRGTIDLPAGLLSFLMRGHFDPQLAEVVRFEAEVD